MDEYKVNVTKPAKADLREILNYISFQLHAPEAAANTVRSITASLDKLRITALMHPIVREERLALRGYRLLIVKNYIAFYIVNEKEKTVEVDRIGYGRQDWKKIL